MSFLSKIKPHAIASYSKSKILPSIVGAQAILESASGTSDLAKNANNLFGIKGAYNGQSYSKNTQEWSNGTFITVKAAFRKYPSWQASIADYGGFFTSTTWRKKNYKAVLNAKDYKAQAKALQSSGYATDPSYANKLINVIEKNGLAAWDKEIGGNTNMVKDIFSSYINKPFTPKKNSIKGVIIHNDAGAMTPSDYLTWLTNRVKNGQAELGFAALYVNRNEALWFSPTDYAEWHAGNQNGNYNYVGFEVCESMPSKTNNATFLQNEETTLMKAAAVMKSYNLPVNRTTVMLHNEFSSTACPHRSWDIHVGKGAAYNQTNKNKLKDYFISRIKFYMQGGDTTETASGEFPIANKGWSWSATCTSKETIVVRFGYKSSGAPRLHLNKPVDESSYIQPGEFFNIDHIWFADGLWWGRMKYPNGANTNFFFIPLGVHDPKVNFQDAAKKGLLWVDVEHLNMNAKTSGVKDWTKKGAVNKPA